MAVLSKKDFAAKCGKETKWLSNYISRKNVITLSDGAIDTEDPRNKSFLAKWSSISGNEVSAETPSETSKPMPPKQNKNQSREDQEDEEEDPENWSNLDVRKKKADIKKKEAEIESVLIKNKVLKGQLLPYELMKPLIRQNNHSITTSFKNTIDEIILNMAKKKEFTREEVAELNAFSVKKINEAVKTATEQSIKGVDLLVKEYQNTNK